MIGTTIIENVPSLFSSKKLNSKGMKKMFETILNMMIIVQTSVNES